MPFLSPLNLTGWSVLLSQKSLKKASKQLRDMCNWPSDVPTILSACLVSMEPDSSLRLMSDQFTPDERFGQTASNCQLSTPKDASATHILVFPTSAKAQVIIVVVASKYFLVCLSLSSCKNKSKFKESYCLIYNFETSSVIHFGNS